MTEADDTETNAQADELDEFEEFARAHPELCVEITPGWKESLLKKLESAFPGNLPEP